MATNNIKRIYEAVSPNFAVETDWVLVDDNKSFQKVDGERKTESIEELKSHGFLVLDGKTEDQPGQHGTIKLNLKLDQTATEAAIKIELGRLIFEAENVQHEKLTVGGSYGAATLKTLVQLSQKGKLKIIGFHVIASEPTAFADVVEKTVTHDNATKSETKHSFQHNHNHDADCATIQMNDTTLDGFTTLEYTLPKDTAVQIELTTIFYG